jgi:hypothetical protein
MAEDHGLRSKLMVALISVASALAGYFAQNMWNRQRERSNAFEERQNRAYDAVVEAFDKYRLSNEALARAEKALSEEARKEHEATAAKHYAEYEQQMRLAGRRVGLYGHKEVVRTVANWHRAYNPDRPPACDAKLASELEMWASMREALLVGDQQVSDDDLATIVGPSLCTPALRK